MPPPKALVHFVHSSALGGGTLPTTITRKKGQKSTGAISNAKWRRKIPFLKNLENSDSGVCSRVAYIRENTVRMIVQIQARAEGYQQKLLTSVH